MSNKQDQARRTAVEISFDGADITRSEERRVGKECAI